MPSLYQGKADKEKGQHKQGMEVLGVTRPRVEESEGLPVLRHTPPSFRPCCLLCRPCGARKPALSAWQFSSAPGETGNTLFLGANRKLTHISTTLDDAVLGTGRSISKRRKKNVLCNQAKAKHAFSLLVQICASLPLHP